MAGGGRRWLRWRRWAPLAEPDRPLSDLRQLVAWTKARAADLDHTQSATFLADYDDEEEAAAAAAGYYGGGSRGSGSGARESPYRSGGGPSEAGDTKAAVTAARLDDHRQSAAYGDLSHGSSYGGRDGVEGAAGRARSQWSLRGAPLPAGRLNARTEHR